MSLTCAHCHLAVIRKNCHRNRYGEMICHACQRTGVRFTWRQRLRLARKWAPLYAGIGLAVAVLVALFFWFLYLASLPESQTLLN